MRGPYKVQLRTEFTMPILFEFDAIGHTHAVPRLEAKNRRERFLCAQPSTWYILDHMKHRAESHITERRSAGRADALAPVWLLGGGLDHLDVGQRLLGRDAGRPAVVLAEGGPVDLRRDEAVDLAHVAGEARVGRGRAWLGLGLGFGLGVRVRG